MNPILLLFFSLIFCAQNIIFGYRSSLRPTDPEVPELITRWEDSSDHYHLKDLHLEMHPIFFTYDKEHFEKHLLPQKKIKYRTDKEKEIDGKKLCRLIEKLSKELTDGKTKFKHFEVIKRKDFNYRTLAGNMVLKCTKYPVVIKIFVESPESFVKPYTKGWQTAIFYQMGGGINRFLSGFTRIKNLERVQKKIDEDEYWCNRIALPRKWFWLPENPKYFKIESKNIGNQGVQSISVPSTYAIVADSIDIKLTFDKWHPKHKKTSLKFCKFIGNCIDPHIDNFVIEKKTKRIVIVDTEHFACMVGLKEKLEFDSYMSWYCQLVSKCAGHKFLTHRHHRRTIQTNPTPVIEA